MSTKSLEIISSAVSDSFDLLDESALDSIRGGAVSCSKTYSQDDNGKISCGCGYTNTKPAIKQISN
jgi:hypothetical protein